MARSGIVIDVSEIRRNVKDLPDFIDRTVAFVLLKNEAPAENYMKSNAPWTDRTTNARNGLAARYTGKTGTEHHLVFFHQVPYGFWLEVKHDGSYAIIRPTMDEFGPRVMADLRGVLRGGRS